MLRCQSAPSVVISREPNLQSKCIYMQVYTNEFSTMSTQHDIYFVSI
jgi:hypothetical protein